MARWLRGAGDPVEPHEFASAARVATPFVALLLVALLWRPPTPQELSSADPLIQLVEALGGPWLAPALCAIVIGAWLVAPRLPASTAGSLVAWGRAAAGAACALVVAGVLRVAFGPELPAFVPPEESARPGVALGLDAGLIEEALFRLVTLPAVYFALRDRTGERAAKVVATLATGLAFAVSHEFGPGAVVFDPGYFATRFVFPGCIMSAGCFLISPAFVVAAHCTAHLVIPALFA